MDDYDVHDLAGCQIEPCALCCVYNKGYARGKEKAWFELETWNPNHHSPGCKVMTTTVNPISKVVRLG